ncbi:hypothetical protein DL89DRAFT_322022 [Linderina pennispora]|uniref:SGNH hydrolase n=1 Tax=Linderina pennispora TaxID=61395 RepID=A0A1Y1WAU9_9FUNG|nr:uncharacterized protein DL89DRAFT_322022 [Linderina pennispora]ORX70562.1 hypothetical protein DL89DRAFT_322022 [Linderina pennispora]
MGRPLLGYNLYTPTGSATIVNVKASADLANHMIKEKITAWAEANGIDFVFGIADLDRLVEITQGSTAITSALSPTNIEYGCVGGDMPLTFVTNIGKALLCKNPTSYYFFDFTAYVAVAKPTLHVFGDSLSDVGTLRQLTLGIVPPPPYWNGRFSSGPVWNEYLALKLGYNSIPSAQDQINYFKFIKPLYQFSPTRNDDLAVLAIGANDYFATMFNLMLNTTTPEKYATVLSDTIVGQLEQLKKIGFRNIYVANVAAIQYTPMAQMLKIQGITAKSVNLVNQMIHDKTAAWAKTAGLKLFGIADIGRSPGALGLKNMNEGCVGGELAAFLQDDNFIQHLIDFITNIDEALLCKQPTYNYFFDPVHPAERIQRLYGYFTYEVITAARSGSNFALSEDNLLSIIQKYGLNSVAPKPAAI